MSRLTHEEIRNVPPGKRQLNKIRESLIAEYGLTLESMSVVERYLETRQREVKGKESFGAVFVLTNQCNLNCLHCGVNAKLVHLPKGQLESDMSLAKARVAIEKIADYTERKGFRPFLMFGGGEPSLLRDFFPIVRYASETLGAANVGFCTNGTTLSIDDLLAIEPYVGLIETSIDGTEKEHNSMRDPHQRTGMESPYKLTMGLVKQAVKVEDVRRKLEVSAIATRRNYRSLPHLARYLRGEGVQSFSTHRAIPVGRMATNHQHILTRGEYLEFFIEMARVRAEDSGLRWHMHHSLETIYSVLFTGTDIHYDPRLPMGSGRHSIGIDWEGYVFFDAWSVVSPFGLLRSQNLTKEGTSLFEIIDSSDSMVGVVNDATKKNLRCKQCRLPCSGGMRFNAIFSYAVQVGGRVRESHFLAGLSEIDPGCLVS